MGKGEKAICFSPEYLLKELSSVILSMTMSCNGYFFKLSDSACSFHMYLSRRAFELLRKALKHEWCLGVALSDCRQITQLCKEQRVHKSTISDNPFSALDWNFYDATWRVFLGTSYEPCRGRVWRRTQQTSSRLPTWETEDYLQVWPQHRVLWCLR